MPKCLDGSCICRDLKSFIRDGEFTGQPRNCQVQPTPGEAKKEGFHLHVIKLYWIQIRKQNEKEKKKTWARFELHSLRPDHLAKLVCSQGKEFATLRLADQTGIAAFSEQNNTEFTVNRLRDGSGKKNSRYLWQETKANKRKIQPENFDTIHLQESFHRKCFQ